MGSAFVISNANRIPIALVMALVVVVFGSFWAILKGFFGNKNRTQLGVQLKREEEPKLWDLCDKVSQEVGTETVDEITLSPLPGIGVYLQGSLLSMLVGRTKRTLIIGACSISGLSISQMEAILAHEFGHFSNKDTAWNSLTFTMGASLQNALSTMPNPSSAEGFWMKLTSALNPSLWVLWAYRLLFLVVTNGFSRMREVFADKTAIALYGYENFTQGLTRVARNDHVFSSQFVPEIAKMLKQEGKMFINVFLAMEQAVKSLNGDELATINESIQEGEKSSLFDSHPLLKDRLAYAKYFQVETQSSSQDDIKILFSNWDQTFKNMSDLYTYYLGYLIGCKFEDIDESDRALNMH